MSSNMLTVKELAKKWGVTPRRISQLCSQGLIPGAVKENRIWKIPAQALRPNILRSKKSDHPVPRTRTTELLPCPVGITSYKEASAECYYVDKTLLIKELLDDHSKVFLFTRPRRFGKTLTLDMLKTYFEATEEDTSVYFSNKKIWSCGDAYQRYQGAYPVIFLSFKDARQNNWEDMYKSLRFTIRNEFRRHRELLESGILTESDKHYFSSVLNSKIDSIDCQAALGELSYMLAQHYGSKVIIIIDEYDTPIQQGHLGGYYEQIIGFMRNLFSAGLKDNENLEFGVLTGVLRVAKESLFSGLNNLAVNTILDEKYAEYFGFTPDEVCDMAAYYGKNSHLKEINDWYDGYCFGSREIYNPWSVISYFNHNCKPKAFWSRTSSNDIIGQLIRNANQEIYDSLTLLMLGKEIQSVIDTDIIYPEITGNPDAIYSFLLVAGYLKITSIISDVYDNPICGLTIPNKEIRSVFQKEILNSFGTLFTGPIIRNFALALHSHNMELFQKTLQDFLMRSVSNFDTAQESFYHGMVLGMLSIMSDNYYISSNRESGAGRFDVQLEPKEKAFPGFILEFKAGKGLSDSQLNALAKEGLEQIRSKQYATDMHNRGVKNIHLYGIAFCGKKVAVECE